MDKRRIWMLVAILLLCGARAVSAQSAERMPTGVWVGVISGRETADVKGCCNEQAARLVVNDDGTWTMRTASWQASGTMTSRRDGYALEGSFISGNPAQPVGPARYHLDHVSMGVNEVLMGNASALYNGLHIVTGIILRKVQ